MEREARKLRLWPLLLLVCLFLVASSPPPAEAALVIDSPNGEFDGTGTFQLTITDSAVDSIRCGSGTVKGSVSKPINATAAFSEWTLGSCTVYNANNNPVGAATVTVLRLPSPVQAVSTTKLYFGAFTVKASFNLQYEGSTKACNLEVTFSPHNPSYANGPSANTAESLFSSTESYNSFFSPYPCPLGPSLFYSKATFNFPDPKFEVKEAFPPSAGIPKPASSSGSSATIYGSVKPNAYATEYYFEYGTNGYETRIPVPNGKFTTELSKEYSVSQLIQNLKPGATYHYRLVAKNEIGTSETPDQTFVVPAQAPKVEITKPASSSSKTSATLFGAVTPNGLSTEYYFEYGLGIGYGTKIPVPSTKITVELSKEYPVSLVIQNLKPNTTYHYRLVAINSLGTSPTPDQSFTTPVWEAMPSPNPSGAAESRLDSVDCVPSSTSMCMAVGRTTASPGSGNDILLAERWNGTSWTLTSPVGPPGASGAKFEAVTCPSATSCKAAGSYTTSTGTYSLIEAWDGASWSIQQSYNVPGASSTVLTGVSCPSGTTSCVAAGYGIVGGERRAIAQRWNGSGWSPETIPTPAESLDSEFFSVECRGSNFCMAVGRYTKLHQFYTVPGGGTVTEEFDHPFSAVWNGSQWTEKTVPEIGYRDEYLADISCTGTTAICTAVGNSSGPGFGPPFFVRWSGTAWTLQSSPYVPEDGFHGISCAMADSSSCAAVGSRFWLTVEGAEITPAAARWNGTAWALEGTTAGSQLVDVSCRGSICVAVGWNGNNTLAMFSDEAEASEPSGEPPTITTKPASSPSRTKATLKGTVNPNGSETTYQFEYGTTTGYGSKAPASPKSIGSGTSSVEVSEGIEGLAPETTYHFRLVGTNAKGTTNGPDQTFTTPSWEILSTPNPSGASDSNLYDISCEPSTNACTAVGKSTVSGADIPVAQRWNGTSWSEQSAAKKSGSTHNRLLGVDCPSETRCIAVGNYQNSEGGPATLGELWNENKWNVQTTPVPSGATSSELAAVGCNNTAECMAAGSAMIGGVKMAIAEEWNSPTWALSTVPIPSGAKSSQLDGIDCIWSGFCVAVGRYTTSGDSVKSLAMFWNGTSWSLQALTDPEKAVQSTLLDVSCAPTPNVCTAVGGWKNSAGEQFTLAYRFTGGSTWTLQSTPNPAGSAESVFQDVSCPTETSCTAGGSWVGSAASRTLVEAWNGTSWSIQGTSDPSSATFSSLFGVSCRSTTCIGVGWSTDGSGVDTTLGETH